MKRKLLSLVLGICLVLPLAACSKNTSGSSDASNAEASEETSGTAEDTSDEETVTDAPQSTEAPQLSGKVVVYCPSPEDLADKIAEAFQEKTGVEVEMFQGTTGEILARLETEKDNPVADVVIMASWADGLNMIAADQVMSFEPENTSNVNWKDEENKIFGYSASAAGVIYNTTIFPTLSADWDVLGTDAKYKDQIAIPDPTKSGSCKDFLSGFVNICGEKGEAIIDSWVANGVTVPGANKAALEAVITGEKGILIAGVDYNAYSSIDAGEPLGIYYPQGGTVINPRPAMILKSSKNVDNAKAYMDFLLSDEAQRLICDAYLLPGMKNITSDKGANIADIPAWDLDWSWMGEHSQEISENLINSVN